MVLRDGLPVIAIIRFSLAGLKREAKIDRIIAAVTSLGEEIAGKLVVIEPARVRTRQMPQPD